MIVGKRVAAEIVPVASANQGGVAFQRPRSSFHQQASQQPAFQRPRSRSRAAIWCFAFSAAVGFALVNVVDPYSGAAATPAYADAIQNLDATSRYGSAPVQSLTAPDASGLAVSRDEVAVKPKPIPPPAPAPTEAAKKATSGGSSSSNAPAAGTPDPGSAQAIAYQMLQARGMGDDQYSCLVSLWNKESHWNVYAHNKSSGAYGIPQALPGSKMASAGADWQTNAATQITWGLGYISGRYGSPCGAWGHSQSSGWY